MPTILDLLGVAAPAAAQGTSVAPLARGDGVAGPAPEVVSEWSRGTYRFESIRRDGLTYIDENGTAELFADRLERENEAASRPADVTALRAALERWRTACAPLATALAPRGAPVQPADEDVRRLRALGYVE
jgi:hypothetical protein